MARSSSSTACTSAPSRAGCCGRADDRDDGRGLMRREDGTTVAIPVISADSHIDIGWLPADTFTSRVPASWRTRAPEIVDTDGGPKWVADGTVLSGVAAVGSRGRRYTRGRW